MAETSSSSENTLNINIRAPGDKKVEIHIASSATVLELKQEVAGKTDIEADRQRLIYSGRVLKDEEPISNYKIRPGDTVHLVKGASKSAPPPVAAQVPQSVATGNSFAGNPLAPLLNATNQGVGNFNPFADMGVNTNDPNMMQNMLQSPQAQEQMRSMLNNPAVIDQIIENSPELRNMGPGVRQILQSDHFRNLLTNPQQMGEMMRQAEQMRNNPMFAGMLGGMGGAGGANPMAALGGMGGLGALGGAGGAGATDPWGAPLNNNAATGETAQQQRGGAQNLFNPQAQQPQAQAGAGAAAGGGAAPGQGQMPDFAALQQMMNAFGGGGGAGGAGAGAGGFGGGFGGFGGAPPAPAQQQDSRPPEERFSTQLQTLNEMGFVNPQANIRALQACGGNVQAAIEFILNSQSW